jgi:hypothetical protein
MTEPAEQLNPGETAQPASGEPASGEPASGEPGPGDPVRLLVKAVGSLPAEERDQLYAWLLRRASVTRWPTPIRLQRESGELRALLEEVPPAGRLAAQPSAQQVVPVRFPAEQHAALREWCSEHGFSMATVIRGLVARFLEGRLPERS